MSGARVVLAATGSAGDVYPVLAVALELKAMGLEPVIATRRSFQTIIEGEGVKFGPLRPDLEDLQAIGLDPETVARGVTDPVTGLRFLIRELITPFVRQSYDDLMAATDGAAFMVAHNVVVAAPLVAEQRGLPWMSAVLQPFSLMSARDRPVLGMAPAIDWLRPILPPPLYGWMFDWMAKAAAPWFEPVHQLRADLGLRRDGRTPILQGPYSSLGTLALYSPLLGAAQPDFPPNTQVTGFPFYDRALGGPFDLSPQLCAFLDAGEPPIVFTLGTTAVLNPGDFYRQSASAAAALGRRAVLLTGEGETFDPAAPPDQVFACAYAPHSALFPRAAMVVHHGGIGTCAQALRAGRPQLVVPFMADQPDNAARLHRLGVASVIPHRRYRATVAAATLDRTIRRATIQNRARELSRVVEREDGGTIAARAIVRAMSAQA